MGGKLKTVSKTFRGDLVRFLSLIKSDTPFSLSRFGDGELMILEKEFIDIRGKGSGEFRYDPNNEVYEVFRNELFKSFTYEDPNYYIGIACRCCVGDDKFNQMINKSGVKLSQLTWANIFVNSNYSFFLNEFKNLLKSKAVNIICNEKSNISNLPFEIKNVWYVKEDAWVNNQNIIKELTKYLDGDIKNEIFLYSAGPLANILVYKSWLINHHNTYLDIGSVYDKILGLIPTRKYLNGGSTLKKTCIW